MSGNFPSALDGMRVLDLTEDRGLYAGRLLADLGADVIKIEKPGGSQARCIGPFKDDVPGTENSLYFANFNTNKRGITLDLERPAGKDIFKQLARRADVVIEDFAVGAMQSLGLDYPVLRELNRRLIMASVTGFGQTGPYSHYQSPDIVCFAMGGVMYTSGEADRAPVVAPCDQAFHSVSILSVFGILAALYIRMSNGEGRFIDVSAHEVAAAFAQGITRYSVSAELGGRAGSQTGSTPSRIFPCKDGYIHLVVLRPHHWRGFRAVLGNPEVMMGEAWDDASFRARNGDLINALVLEFTMPRTKEELTELFQSKGIPCVPVNTPADFAQHPHTKDRGFLTEIEHPVIGRHPFLGPPYRLSRTPCRINRPAPLLGQHNREVYSQELGYTDEVLARFRADEII
ncbi:MAG: CoA transferase [Chloroflexi bacterium]|nr:CoA transferase [Chloroflexota bacterium]